MTIPAALDVRLLMNNIYSFSITVFKEQRNILDMWEWSSVIILKTHL